MSKTNPRACQAYLRLSLPASAGHRAGEVTSGVDSEEEPASARKRWSRPFVSLFRRLSAPEIDRDKLPAAAKVDLGHARRAWMRDLRDGRPGCSASRLQERRDGPFSSRRGLRARLAVVAGPDDNLFGAEHVRVYRETSGERGYDWRGAHILLLTTRGRRSGEPRTTPLIHRTDGDDWVVVASKGGAPENPSWFENLQADPDPTIQVRGDTIPVQAETADGERRERLWSLMNEVWPAYEDYQAKTDRQIPVVVLSRR